GEGGQGRSRRGARRMRRRRGLPGGGRSRDGDPRGGGACDANGRAGRRASGTLSRQGRSPDASLGEMAEIVLPEDSNTRGTIFGGRVLALIDKCAAIAAMRHAQTQVVTASLDSVDFHSGVRLGNVLVLNGRLNAVFRSSMEVEVEVHAEDPFSGARHLTTRAFVTM